MLHPPGADTRNAYVGTLAALEAAAPEEYAAWEAADSAFQAANTALEAAAPRQFAAVEETALKALIPEL